MSELVLIESIIVNGRHRQDMGDIDALASSIADIGLLHPVNQAAKMLVSERTDMTEYEWVALLYKMRGRDIPKDLFAEQVMI